MLAALAKRKLQAALFVCGKRIDNPAGHELVSAWNQQGHLIANHSYSHFFFNDVTLRQFEDDAIKNEPFIRDYPHFSRLFRYPFFKEGDTAEKRDGMRAFLQQHGYGIGRSTIDASDWAISARLEKRAKAVPNADFTPYRDFFLQHIRERAQFTIRLRSASSLSPSGTRSCCITMR